MMKFDCAIIGGGPAGLNAALVLGRARRSTLLIDNGKPRNAVAKASHGFITRDGVAPSEFRRIAHEELLRYPAVRYRSGEIADVSRTVNGFHIVTEEGERIEARKVILATGLRETLPEIAGLSEFYGSRLFPCPFCDGWEQRDRSLVLISEGTEAFHMAKMILNWSPDLIVCTNGQSNMTVEQREKLLQFGVIVMDQRITTLLGEGERRINIRFQDGTVIRRDGGFVTGKLSPNAPFAENLGCDRNESGAVVTDRFGRTNIAGIYSAGDGSVIAPSQLIVAAADGSRAGIGVTTDLIEEDYR